MSAFRIETLTKQDRRTFDCGEPMLNRYLQTQASQDVRRRYASCYLLIETATNTIAGYYTLAASSVLLVDLPNATQKKLPRYPTVPVIRIGRLAIDRKFQGQKLGGVLLYNAISRSATSGIGAYALVVDALNAQAAVFYQHHGFTPFAGAPMILFLPLTAGAVGS